MKLNLFFAVGFLFAVLHLCKAGPLRVQKRAVFYIANETACVVDNIVYSNGDPIPTDDPCESCKCRPPGFACVLKECKVKPGCKAVRRVGQCCPDYICGCEHNGRMYKDGEEIRDPKNPCYQCYCQGSSIACAFVDCFFRDDCDTFYMPGECCPEYRNCTRDTLEVNQFPRGNALPSVNLLPALNDESVLPADYPSTSQESEQSEKTTDPAPSPTPESNYEMLVPENKEPVKTSSEPQTTVSANEDGKSDPEVEDRNEEEVKLQNEKENDNEKETVKVSDETETLFNSESEIKEKQSDPPTSDTPDPTSASVEKIKEEPQTTISNELVEAESEEATEKSPEDVSSTKAPEGEKQIKNSAADNGKSLKISDEQDAQENEENKTSEPEEKLDETVTELQTELSSEVQTEISKENSTESKPEYKENQKEETQTNPQATSFYSSDDKIKSESAETVTIVVHVREKAKPSTEKESVTEEVTTESEISSTQENLLKSNDELKSTEITEESIKYETVSTEKNFEVLPSSTEVIKEESTATNSPLPKELEKKIEGRSDETDATSEVVENPLSEEKVSDLKNEDESSPATTTQNIDDASQEVTASEKVEEMKTNEPMVTVIKIDPNAALKIKIVSDAGTTILKIKEENIKESESKEAEETEPEDNPVIKDEVKVEENIEVNPEAREDEPTSEEKGEETTPVEKNKETTPAYKSEETTPAYKSEETTLGYKSEETTLAYKSEETTPAYKSEEIKPEYKSEEIKPEYKSEESTSTQKSEETTIAEKKVEATSAQISDETTPAEEIKESTATEKSEVVPEEKVKESKSVDSTPEAYKTTEKIQETEYKETTEQTTTAEITKTEKSKHHETKEHKIHGSEK